jgi:hypothetical protein
MRSLKLTTTGEEIELLRTLVAGQRAIETKLDGLLARLAPGPRDQGDVELVVMLITIAQGHTFTAAAVWRRRAVDTALAEALATADIENPQQLGKLLKRNEGRDVVGVRFRRVGTGREGIIWQQEWRE